jgi:hypothetical protein
MKSVSFTLASKRTKHLIKEVKDLYTESYKRLLKEIIGDINKWKDILRIGRLMLGGDTTQSNWHADLMQYLSKSQQYNKQK